MSGDQDEDAAREKRLAHMREELELLERLNAAKEKAALLPQPCAASTQGSAGGSCSSKSNMRDSSVFCNCYVVDVFIVEAELLPNK
jgi:hypothetical protein